MFQNGGSETNKQIKKINSLQKSWKYFHKNLLLLLLLFEFFKKDVKNFLEVTSQNKRIIIKTNSMVTSADHM